MYLKVGRVVHHMAQYLVLPTHKGAKQQVTFRDIWGYGKTQSYSLSYVPELPSFLKYESLDNSSSISSIDYTVQTSFVKSSKFEQ